MTTLDTRVDHRSFSPAELADLMRAYQEATERLQAAHGELQREVKRLNDELAEKNAELARKERMAALGQMAAGVAHEIRNPLGALRLFAGTLKRELVRRAPPVACPPASLPSNAQADTPPAFGSEAQARRVTPLPDAPPPLDTDRMLGTIEKIVRAISMMDGIVEGMLDLARTRDPAVRPCDLVRVIDEAVEAAAQDIEARRIRVTRGAPGRCHVHADADQLRRAFLNIIINATQAMVPGGRLEVAVARDEDRVRVRFTDTGPGIDPAHIERIFEPFFSAREGGTGLGLALVHRIVEGHHGRLWARNEPTGGAAFFVELPAAEDRDHAHT